MIATNTLSIADLQLELTKLIADGVDPLTPIYCGEERYCNDAYPNTHPVARLRKHESRTGLRCVEILTD